MKSQQLTITNESGMHARPASIFVKKAHEFEADIRLGNLSTGSELVDGKSILHVLSLGIEQGHKINLIAEGPDETEAIRVLVETIQAGFSQNGGSKPSQAVLGEAAGAHPGRTQEMQGIAGGPGLAEGSVWHLREQAFTQAPAQGRGYEVERERLERAVEAAKQDVLQLKNKIADRAGRENAAIFEVHLMFLQDDAIWQQADQALRAGLSAEKAWQDSVAQFANHLKLLPNETLRMRSADLYDIGQRVLAQLDIPATHITIPDGSVLVGRDLLPSQAAALDPARVLAFCTAEGGPTSHTAILARALGLPAVVGLGSQVLEVPEGTKVLVDGTAGKLVVSPSPETEQAFKQRLQETTAQESAQRSDAHRPAVTRDGHVVKILANIAGIPHIPAALQAGAEGIGLFRTEFLFLDRQSEPDEQEQFEVYRSALEPMRSKPVVIRTLDIGGDKDAPYLGLKKEPNPFLGFRGIRISLAEPEFFKRQLRALLRAGYGHDLRIMFPFISTVEELQQAKGLLEEARREVLEAGQQPVETVRTGAMIEVPAAVMMAERLAKYVDFFSIGTNDLTQYMFAADRSNEKVASLQDGCHPVILGQIKKVVEAAHAAGIEVSICGELAGNAQAIPFLVGLGVDELSMGAAAIPRVKAAIRGLSLKDAQKLAAQALQQDSAAAVRALNSKQA